MDNTTKIKFKKNQRKKRTEQNRHIEAKSSSE